MSMNSRCGYPLSARGPERPRRSARSNFGVDQWSGRLLDGSVIHFSQIDAPKLVLNFYSPTCQPCIQEIPALEHFAAEAAKRKIPVYVALESSPSSHGLNLPADATPEDRFQAIRNRMMEDIQKYSMRLPVVVMDDNFRINPEYGTVTGTPETLIFSTKPLLLRYNFIGPIGTAQDAATIERQPRYQFALERL